MKLFRREAPAVVTDVSNPEPSELQQYSYLQGCPLVTEHISRTRDYPNSENLSKNISLIIDCPTLDDDKNHQVREFFGTDYSVPFRTLLEDREVIKLQIARKQAGMFMAETACRSCVYAQNSATDMEAAIKIRTSKAEAEQKIFEQELELLKAQAARDAAALEVVNFEVGS